MHPWAVEEVITLSPFVGNEELLSGDFVVTVGVEPHKKRPDIVFVILGHNKFVGGKSEKVLNLGLID